MQAEITESDHIFLWLRRNRGVLSKIARELEITPEFVRQVLYHRHIKSNDSRVEQALLEAGAPFMGERLGVSQ